MMAGDPKAVAQERFAERDWNERGLSLVERCATDPPIVVRGLVNAVREQARPGSRVIELGFGSGWLMEALRDELPDVSLFGLDLSPGFARRVHEECGDRVRVLLGDMERLPFDDGSFDVIATCWTLYFMRDIDAALAEIKRCLAPGGRLIAGTNAPEHEAECGELVSESIRVALGRDEPDHDVATRFDLETGEPYVRRHFPHVEVKEWRGEMVLSDPDDVEALWPKWEPAMLPKEEQQAVRVEFLRLARERLDRDGALRIRRHNGAFVCDLAGVEV
ncbi:MAG: class I SAM-dependent methyltransferase [Dehalococcoidia bacterium]